MSFALVIIAMFLTFQYINYQVETKDKSMQGFIEYLKKKFYYKNND